MTKIICISGKAQHGKDTTASILQNELEKLGNRVVIIHYADLLKFICTKYFNWDGNKDKAGRTMLQEKGKDARDQNPDYWVDFVIGLIRMYSKEWDYVLIPDTRYPNEVEKITSDWQDTVHMRIVRPNFDNGLTEQQKMHSSETALDDYPFDMLIENTTMEELKNNILEVLPKITNTQKGDER